MSAGMLLDTRTLAYAVTLLHSGTRVALQVHHPVDKLLRKRRVNIDEQYFENGVLYDVDDGVVSLHREFDWW
jgi:hypothetical protein